VLLIHPLIAVLYQRAIGVVESVGNEVTMFNQGDIVYYSGSPDQNGSNAEYQLLTACSALIFLGALATNLSLINWYSAFDPF
jgi:NADPH:quinone reductase-like Zn-dependent oxidoreductase